MTDPVQRLLVVCDEEGDPSALVQRYRAEGYEVDAARGAGAACTVLRRPQFSVMVADLPAADEAALAVVRAAGRTQSAPRILLLLPRVSADAPLALARMREAACVCLRRPVDLERLDELIATACADVVRARLAARWPQVREALAGVSAGAGPGPASNHERPVSDEVARRLRAERDPHPDVAAVESRSGALRAWAARALVGRRAA